MINKIQNLRKTLILFLLMSIASIVNGQAIFDLKGKNIVIMSDKPTYDASWRVSALANYTYFGNTYTAEALEKNQFKNKYRVDMNWRYVNVVVDDVYYINPTSNNKKAIVLKLRTNDNSVYAIYMPLRIKTGIMIPAKLGEEIHIVDPGKIFLSYFDIAELKAFEKKYLGKRFFFKNSDDAMPYTFKGFDEYCLMMYEDGKGQMLHNSITPKELYIPENSNWTRPKHLASNWILEDSLIAQCVKNSNQEVIEHFNKKYKDQKVYVKTAKLDDYYTVKGIEPRNIAAKGRDYQYVAKLEDGKRDIYVPLKDIEVIQFEKDRKAELKREYDRAVQAEAEREAQEARAEAEEYAKLVRKYGKKNAAIIADGAVRLGFTKQMCIDAWGEPYDVTTVTNQFGSIECWIYGSSFLYFRGGKVVQIID